MFYKKPMKTKIIVIAILVISAFLGAYFSLSGNTANGSVIQGGEYQATTTNSTWVSATVTKNVYNGGSNEAKVLGSIIIASSSPITAINQVVIYDATSTMATATARVIAKIGSANQTHGTYTFDTNLFYGLKVETTTGFNGNFIITFR